MIDCMRELLLSDKVTVDLSQDELINAAKKGNFNNVKKLILSELDEINEWSIGATKEFLEEEIDKFEKHAEMALISAAKGGHQQVVKFISSLLNASYPINAFDQAIKNGDVTSVKTLISLDIVKQAIHQSTRTDSGSDYYDLVMRAADKGDIAIVRELLKNDSIRQLVSKNALVTVIPGKLILSETLGEKIAQGLRSMFLKSPEIVDADTHCKMIIDTLCSRFPQLHNVAQRKESHIAALTAIYSLTNRSPLGLDPVFLITKMLLPAKDLNFTKKGKAVSVTDENIRHFVETARRLAVKRG